MANFQFYEIHDTVINLAHVAMVKWEVTPKGRKLVVTLAVPDAMSVGASDWVTGALEVRFPDDPDALTLWRYLMSLNDDE